MTAEDTPTGSLARFFSLLEEVAATPLHAHTFAERLGASLAPLVAAGFVISAGSRTDDHCGGELGGDCRRRVVRERGVTPRRLVAHCTRTPARCASRYLGDADVRALAISLRALERALALVFGLRGTPEDATGILVKLGDQPRRLWTTREVFVAWRPGDPAFAPLLAQKERAGPRSLVLVPTIGAMPMELVARFARSRRVELLVLSEIVSMDGQALVRRPPVVPEAPKKARRQRPREVTARDPVPLPKPARWSALALHRLSNERLLVRAGKEEVVATPFDLGLENKKTGEPVDVWTDLASVCENQGYFTGRRGLARDNVPVTRLRKALKSAFGPTGNPFWGYRPRDGWRARFVASPHPPKGWKPGKA